MKIVHWGILKEEAYKGLMLQLQPGCCADGNRAALPCFIFCLGKVFSLCSVGIELAFFVDLKSVIRTYFRKRRQSESHTGELGNAGRWFLTMLSLHFSWNWKMSVSEALRATEEPCLCSLCTPSPSMLRCPKSWRNGARDSPSPWCSSGSMLLRPTHAQLDGGGGRTQ